MTNIDRIIAGLSEAQKRFLCACSVRPKKWAVIRRHAKISKEVRIHRMVVPLGLVVIGNTTGYLTTITETGKAVRARLQQGDGS